MKNTLKIIGQKFAQTINYAYVCNVIKRKQYETYSNRQHNIQNI